ncbi:hypothetical protein Esti_000427 [Eimeria stiedai]
MFPALETPPSEGEQLLLESPSLLRRSADGNPYKGRGNSTILGRPCLAVATGATFLSVLLVVFVISKCHTWKANGTVLSSATRRLADENIEQGDAGEKTTWPCYWILASDAEHIVQPSTSDAGPADFGEAQLFEGPTRTKEAQKRNGKHLASGDAGSPAAKTTSEDDGSFLAAVDASASPFQPFKGLLPLSSEFICAFPEPWRMLEELVDIIDSDIEPPADFSNWSLGEFDLGMLLEPSGEGLVGSQSWSVSPGPESPAVPGGEDVGFEVKGHQERLGALSPLQPSEDLLGEADLSLDAPPRANWDPLEFLQTKAESLRASDQAPVHSRQHLASSSSMTSSTVSTESPRSPETPSSDEAKFVLATFIEAQRATPADHTSLSSSLTYPMDGLEGRFNDQLAAQSAEYRVAPGLPQWPKNTRQPLQGPQASRSSVSLPYSISSSQHAGAAPVSLGGFRLSSESKRPSYIPLQTPPPTTPAGAQLIALLNRRRSLGQVPLRGREAVQSTAAFAPQTPKASFWSPTSLSPSHSVQERLREVVMRRIAAGADRLPGHEPVQSAAAPASQPSAGLSGKSTSWLVRESARDHAAFRRDELASAGPSTGGELLSEWYFKNHLYYRIPRASPIGALPPLNLKKVYFGYAPSLSSVLKPIRAALIKDQLTSTEAQKLFFDVTKLIKFAKGRLQSELKSKRSGEMTSRIGARLLVADALYCAAEVLGPSLRKDMWWPSVVGDMLRPALYWSPNATGEFREKLMQRMIAAAEIYRRGERPPAKLVVAIKRDLFVNPKVPPLFKDPEWDPWKEDDRIDWGF